MTLMGAKRDGNTPRKPMRRSNGSLTARAGSKATTEVDEAYKAFMASFRGLVDPFSERTWLFYDDKGERLQTCGHHILPRSVYPEYKMEPMNVIPLDSATHTWAHDHPSEFQKALWAVSHDQWEWANERSRKGLSK